MSYFVDFTSGPMKAIRFRTGLDFCPYVYYIARMGKYVPRHVQEVANSYEKKFKLIRTKGGLDKNLLDFEIELFKKYKVALVRLNFFDFSFYQDDKIMSTIEGIETGDLEYVGMFDDYDELDKQTRTLKNKVRDGSEFNKKPEDEDNENSDNDSDGFDVPEEELEGLEEEDLELLKSDSEEDDQSNEDEEKDLEHLKELSKKGGEKPFFLQEGYDENSDSEEDSEDDEEELDPDMDKFFENFKKFSEQELEKEMSEKMNKKENKGE